MSFGKVCIDKGKGHLLSNQHQEASRQGPRGLVWRPFGGASTMNRKSDATFSTGVANSRAVCWSVYLPGSRVGHSPLRRQSLALQSAKARPLQRRARFQPRACQDNAAENNKTDQTQAEDRKPDLSDAERFFEGLRKIREEESALSNPLGLKKSYEIVPFNADGTGPRDRYVYVEERDCIGCTHCRATASGTFFMEEDYGRARVFSQTGDAEEVVEEAIDTCPVNCIYYVDWEDLVKLENMREGQRINNSARLVGGQDLTSSMNGDVATKVMDSGIIRCQDCPGRGCAECPMYGVGTNPEYLRKRAIREAKRTSRENGPSKKTRRRL